MGKRNGKVILFSSFGLGRVICILALLAGMSSIVKAQEAIYGSFASKFIRYQKGQPSYGGWATSTWTDTAWKGERLHKQIVLWSNLTRDNVTYSISDLVSGSATIFSSNISLRYINYVIGDVEARSCGAYPASGPDRAIVYLGDALEETPITSITPSDPVKLWVTIKVPATAPAGNYTGTITVRSRNIYEKTFTINLLVTNEVLPDVANWKFNLNIWQFPFNLRNLIEWGSGTSVVPFSSQYFSVIKPFYKSLADMGQKRITSYMFDGAFNYGETMVKWIRNANQTWSFDFTNFDKYVDSLTSWGFTGNIDCFSIFGWQSGIGYYDASNLQTPSPNSPWPNYTTSPGYNATWTGFLTQFRAHLNQKNWFSRAFIFLDEVPSDSMDLIVPLIKAENSGWKIGFAGKYLNAGAEAQISDYSILLSRAGNLRWNQPYGSTTNFYTSCDGTIPNNYLTPQNSPAELTWMPWHAKKKGYHGVLRWACDYWHNLNIKNMQDRSATAGDYHMIYRSTNTITTKPISSIRMELLRDGIQDYEKIRTLGESYIGLNNAINQFTDASGTNALALVQNGQSILKQIAAGSVRPTISYLSPTSGAAGTTVTITGNNFTGATAVKIGGTAAKSFTVVSSTRIIAVVGTGTTGLISVVTPYGTSKSVVTFTVNNNVTYCTVGGPAVQSFTDQTNDDYYVKAVTSTNAIANLNYSTTSFPPGGYTFHTATAVNVLRGAYFNVNLTTSAQSICARSAAWIDWNGDGDFSDAGEQLFGGGTSSCGNLTYYSFGTVVPANAFAGTVRMRIQVRRCMNSLEFPYYCGLANHSGSADFNINIQESLSQATPGRPVENESQIKSIISLRPNPVNDQLQVDVLNGSKIKSSAIFNSMGQLCGQYYFTQSGVQKIDVSGLAQGVYYISVELTDSKKYRLKFIKQ